jgi:hypothetical protein
MYERHYDYQQSGVPLTEDDLSLNTAISVEGLRRAS